MMDSDRSNTALSGYETDLYAWASEQASLLRLGRFSELDVENVAEEIEALGRSQKREFVSRLEVLLLHLLKWQYQDGLRGKSWELTIIEQRRRLATHLAENPSLRHGQAEAMTQAYETAVVRAVRETNMLRDMFAWSCPYSFEQVMDSAFWPEPQ